MAELQIINQLKTIDPEKGYWFVRTDDGTNFDTYYKNGFIGIGWNQISLENLTNLPKSDVINKIAQTENYDLTLKKGKGAVTSIYNKLLRFKNIKKGDVVIIPSKASNRLAFGVVESDEVFTVTDKTNDCEYYKRKKVNWISEKRMSSLDPIFYEIKISRHAISNIKDYEDYIDRVTSTFYFKENFGNFVFEVNTAEDINVTVLLELISNLQKLVININDVYAYGEPVDQMAIKLNLQSPGQFLFKEPLGKSLATLGLMLALNSCQMENKEYVGLENRNDREKAMQFVEANSDTLSKIDETMNELRMNKNEINAVFNRK